MNGNLLFIPNDLLIEKRREISSKSACSKWIKASLLLFALLVSAVNLAQTGPAGVNLGIDIWLDASDLDGDGIFQEASEANTSGTNDVWRWRDKSGQNNHVDTPNVASSPVYIQSDAAFNNKGVVDFDPGDYLWVNSGDWDDSHTIFIVFRQQATLPANTPLFSSGLGSSSGIENIFQIGVGTSGTDIAYQTQTAGGVISQSLFGTQAAALAGPTVLTATRALPNVITTYNNGAQSGTLATANGQSFHRYYVNAGKSNNSTNNCQIAEIIVYDRTLSSAEISKIHAYLSCKYALGLNISVPAGIEPCAGALWYKANAGIDTTATGQSVINWYDQSAYGIHGTQGTNNRRPRFIYKDNNFNPSILFDPTTNADEIDLGSAVVNDSLMIGSSDFSIYAVAAPDSLVSGVLFADKNCGGSPTAGYYLQYNHLTKSWKFSGENSAATNTVSVETIKSSTPYTLMSLSRVGLAYTLKNNEGASNTANSSTPINFSSSGTTSERWIGAANNNCSQPNLDGNLSELIIVKKAPSATEDKQIQSYLALKYGLTLPSSMSSYIASDGTTVVWNHLTHWNDVAGIGRDDVSGLNQRISKSQHKSAIVTIATSNDFVSPNSAASRANFTADGSFLVWGNNNVPASNGWTVTGAPANFAILPQVWRVKETGTVGAVCVQVDVNNPNNNIPTFVDSLFLVRGTSLASAVPVAMTQTSAGIWTVTGIDFGPNDFFSFAVRNRVIVEFSSGALSSGNESAATPFSTVIVTGTINIPTFFVVEDNPITAATPADYTYIHDTILLPQQIYTMTPFNLPGMTLVNDVANEGSELVQFQFSFVGSVGVTAGNADGVSPTNTNHLYTITDDDSYNIAISVLPGGNSIEGSTNVRFAVSMVGSPNLTGTPITGTISLSGTATSGADFSPLSGTPHFSIPNNGTGDTVTVTVLNDLFLEGTETVIGQILTVSPNASITGSSATATITDDELTGVQVIVALPVNAAEGSSLSYTISLAGGVSNQSGGPITGAITYGGTATPVDDYVLLPVSFSIPNLASSTTISVLALNDDYVELSESVSVSIATIVINGISYPSASSASANILDQDIIGLTISVSSAVSSVLENVGTLTYNLQLNGVLINQTGSPITGTVVLTGTASVGGDYTNVTTFSIPNGSGSGVINVTIIDDPSIEATETIIATISNPMPFGIPHPVNNGISVNIFDNDSGGLQISIGSPISVTETAPTGSVSVTFEVSILSGGVSAADITGTVSYSAGTATIGSDFDTLGASVFVIPAGLLTTTLTLPVINDFASEPLETVIATLTGIPSIGSYVNTSSTATISDDDASSLVVTIDTLSSGAEGGSNVFFVVRLELGAINGTGVPITGNLLLSGTASTAQGEDYTAPIPLVYSIPVMQSEDTIVLFVENDLNVEFTETVVAKILTTSQGTIAAVDSITAYIYDNEPLSVSVLSPTDGEEGGNNITFAISIDGGWTNDLGQAITGDISYSGTSTSGADFDILSNFSIPDGQEFVIHTLNVVNDLYIENTESVIITISNINFGVISADSVVTANIIDDDFSSAQLVITSTVNGIESPTPTSAEFVVSFINGLENQTGIPITGTFHITGTAIDVLDFIGSNTFSIPNNSLSDVISFTVNDDPLEEGIETIIVSLASTSLGTFGPDSVAIGELFDDDTDTDHDGLSDIYDPNNDNIDSDCDGIFDGCDYDPNGDGSFFNGIDTDGDGINDSCDADTNNDGTIDNGPDINGDGLNDIDWDPTDDDGDFLPNHVDPNDNNEDSDGDGITDGADADVNGDGIYDNGCDEDGDGIHNEADIDYSANSGNSDDDNDGIVNKWDMTPLDLSGQAINYIVSPNGDNVNETLRIPGIQVFPNHELIIYNRWGTQIYRSTNYKNDWVGEIQSGIVIGEAEIIEGTYFYTLDLGEAGKEYVRGYIEIRK